MNIETRQFGSVLSTRKSGCQAFEFIAPLLRSGKKLVFDSRGVDSVANSFADDLFGRPVMEFGLAGIKAATTFVSINAFSALSIRNAMERRMASCV